MRKRKKVFVYVCESEMSETVYSFLEKWCYIGDRKREGRYREKEVGRERYKKGERERKKERERVKKGDRDRDRYTKEEKNIST